MKYEVYLFLHIVAIITVFITMGAIASHFWQGGNKQNLKNRKVLSIVHGTALLIAFIAGFGLIHVRGYSLAHDHWLYIKMLCWLFLAVFPMLMYKRVIPGKAGVAALVTIALIAVGTVIFLKNT